MDKIAQCACELMERDEPFVLATIFSHSGSTPRSSGSLMIVTADGRGIGTIGGGLLEAEVMSRAVDLIGSGRSEVLHFDLDHDVMATMDMICGGQAEVLLACVRPTDDTREVFESWRRLLVEGGDGGLLTKVMGTDRDIEAVIHGIMTTRDEVAGSLSLSGLEREKLAAAVASGKPCTVPVSGGFVLAAPVKQVSTVHLFGAGHVAAATARVAVLAGFRISVADDRAEYANRDRFPDAWRIRVLERFDQSFSGLDMGSGDFVVILTRGHLHDKTILARALKTRAGYIGMIGSRRKRDAIYGALIKDGFSQSDIDRVHSPIGLCIGAETPEEIAVSIVAEMIRHRARTS
ncbi:MAG: XdhC family protein [Desulfobacteraceae bacterium]|jgi:xanthine dehydrogenase accessory factor